jgi:two-component system LytT family response regulator
MNLRAIIADDEAPARFRVRELLADAGDVEILAEVTNGRQALEAIRQQRPDLIFLDVQMPPPSGVALLKELAPECRPCTIFITAHEGHALQAFELRAVDFLLKPFSAERFHEALNRAREHIATTSSRGNWLRRLLVRDGSTSIVVPVEQIVFIESANNYVVVQTSARRLTLRRTLASFEADLDPNHFVRTSRTNIINLQFVRAIEAVTAEENSVILEGNVRIPLTIGVRELQARLERGVG